MSSSLTSRIVVAALGLPLVLAALWAGGWWLFALVVPAGAVALHEYFVMTRPLRPVSLAGYAGLAGILYAAEVSGLTWAIGALLGSVVIAFLLKGIGGTQGSPTASVGTTVLGTLWIGFGLACVLLLREIPEFGFEAALAVLLAVFASDTAAYAIGRMIGRHKLAPTISPGKTWEGFFAGTAAAVLVTFLALYQDRALFLTIGESVLLGLAIAAAAPLGDLFESMLKRDMGVKDSGRLLAGHGGVLDRIDAILFAFPAAYFVVLALYP
jgi:phosphatidate cytidylyltransferase